MTYLRTNINTKALTISEQNALQDCLSLAKAKTADQRAEAYSLMKSHANDSTIDFYAVQIACRNDYIDFLDKEKYHWSGRLVLSRCGPTLMTWNVADLKKMDSQIDVLSHQLDKFQEQHDLIGGLDSESR